MHSKTEFASAVAKPWHSRLGVQVVAGLVLGILCGFLEPKFASELKILGDIFLSLIRTGIAPLVFLTIVSGINSASDVRRAGRIGMRSLIYFEVLSTIALALGLIVGNVFDIGAGEGGAAANQAPIAAAKSPVGFIEFIRHVVPDNLIGAFTQADTLQVVFLSILIGIGLLALPTEKRTQIQSVLNLGSDLLFSFINLVMKAAPIGTFGAMAFVVGSNGAAKLLSLAQLIVSFYGLVLVFVVCVLGPVSWLAGSSLWQLLRYLKEELLILLGTASSESVLPGLLRKLEKLGCSKQIVGLVLPTGYSFNLDGTGMFLGLSVMFLANSAGVHLTVAEQIGILVVMMLTSKGTAAVSGGSFVVLAATVTSSHLLPIEGLAAIFGIYRILSIGVAVSNTIGNAVATIVIAKWCGEFDAVKAQAELGGRAVPT
ncbi:aerobic C4-dicarboxylate transport protein [Nitrobacteraceae bacterium AZCC 2161]